MNKDDARGGGTVTLRRGDHEVDAKRMMERLGVGGPRGKQTHGEEIFSFFVAGQRKAGGGEVTGLPFIQAEEGASRLGGALAKADHDGGRLTLPPLSAPAEAVVWPGWVSWPRPEIPWSAS